MGQLTINLKSLQINRFGTLEASNEVYILTLGVDLSGSGQLIEPDEDTGLLISEGFKRFNKYAILGVSPLFSKIRRGDKLSIFGDGLLLYGPKDPGGKLSLHTVIMESDRDHRRVGKLMEKAITQTKLFEVIEAVGTLTAATAPQIAAITKTTRFAFETLVYLLKNDRDDVISTFHYSSTLRARNGAEEKTYAVCEPGTAFEINNRNISGNFSVSWEA